jgi:hypothetical protein
MKNVRWLLILGTSLGVLALVHYAYVTGVYVADLRVRTEAMDHGAGYFDILGDGQWHWGPFKPTWKARPQVPAPAKNAGWRVLAKAR